VVQVTQVVLQDQQVQVVRLHRVIRLLLYVHQLPGIRRILSDPVVLLVLQVLVDLLVQAVQVDPGLVLKLFDWFQEFREFQLDRVVREVLRLPEFPEFRPDPVVLVVRTQLGGLLQDSKILVVLEDHAHQVDQVVLRMLVPVVLADPVLLEVLTDQVFQQDPVVLEVLMDLVVQSK
jgi:hypothetical protein